MPSLSIPLGSDTNVQMWVVIHRTVELNVGRPVSAIVLNILSLRKSKLCVWKPVVRPNKQESASKATQTSMPKTPESCRDMAVGTIGLEVNV